MKFGKLQQVLVACSTVWACVYPMLLCSSLGTFGNWLLAAVFSKVCYSAFCSPNRPVPPLEGVAALVYNPLIILLNVALYIALIRFHLHQRRLAGSKITDTQLDQGASRQAWYSAIGQPEAPASPFIKLLNRRTIFVFLAPLVFVIAVVALVTKATGQTSPPTGPQIAFISDRDGNAEIYVMNTDGSHQTRLTTDSAFDDSPAWSPDGGKLAFYSVRGGNWDIYVMNSDGSGQTRLTTNPTITNDPAWSPDGGKIAFTSWRAGSPYIYVMNSDGSGQTRLAAGESHPTWSPAGGQIAFYSEHWSNFDIYVMNSDGSGPTRLAAGRSPTWSPDGSRIAFTAFRDGSNNIDVVNSDGSGQTRLTAGDDPAWSPDGRKIAFTFNGDIYVMNSDGSSQTRLTTDPAFDHNPAWQP